MLYEICEEAIFSYSKTSLKKPGTVTWITNKHMIHGRVIFVWLHTSQILLCCQSYVTLTMPLHVFSSNWKYSTCIFLYPVHRLHPFLCYLYSFWGVKILNKLTVWVNALRLWNWTFKENLQKEKKNFKCGTFTVFYHAVNSLARQLIKSLYKNRISIHISILCKNYSS